VRTITSPSLPNRRCFGHESNWANRIVNLQESLNRRLAAVREYQLRETHLQQFLASAAVAGS
jgi:hypothetical protein